METVSFFDLIEDEEETSEEEGTSLDFLERREEEEEALCLGFLESAEVEEEGPDLEEEEGRSLRVDEEGLSLRVFEGVSTRGLDLAEEESLGRLGMVEHDGDELKIKEYKKKAD